MEIESPKRYMSDYERGFMAALLLKNVPKPEIAKITNRSLRTVYNVENLSDKKVQKHGGGRPSAYGQETAEKIIEYAEGNRNATARGIV